MVGLADDEKLLTCLFRYRFLGEGGLGGPRGDSRGRFDRDWTGLLIHEPDSERVGKGNPRGHHTVPGKEAFCMQPLDRAW